MAPLRQGHPHENEGCQIPDALGNVASESPHFNVFVPMIFSMPLRCALCPQQNALSVVYIHSRDVSLFPFMWL